MFIFQSEENCLEALRLVAPFLAAYLPICALCSGEYPLYFSLVARHLTDWRVDFTSGFYAFISGSNVLLGLSG